MCFPGAETIMAVTGAIGSIAQGVGGMQAGNQNANALEAQGESAMVSAMSSAASVADEGTYKIADQQRDAAASGNLSALEIIADNAAKLGQDIDAIIYGGQLRRYESRQAATQARRAGKAALAGGVIGAAGSLAPLAVPSGSATGMLYGQQGRYGAGSKMTGSTGRIIGGI